MTDSRVEFLILGPLDVRVAGVSVPVGGPKQRALLALLLLSANRVVSRDRLIRELQGEQPMEAADHVLRVQVSRLRKTLASEGADEPRLIARAPGYLLRVEPGELDLDLFEQQVAAGRAALEESDVASAASLLRGAESLWRGRPLADLEFESFVRVDVERLEELRLVAVEQRVDAELALGRHASLVPELEAAIAAQPLRERLQAQLMLALYRCGRQAEGPLLSRSRAVLVPANGRGSPRRRAPNRRGDRTRMARRRPRHQHARLRVRRGHPSPPRKRPRARPRSDAGRCRPAVERPPARPPTHRRDALAGGRCIRLLRPATARARRSETTIGTYGHPDQAAHREAAERAAARWRSG